MNPHYIFYSYLKRNILKIPIKEVTILFRFTAHAYVRVHEIFQAIKTHHDRNETNQIFRLLERIRTNIRNPNHVHGT